MYSVFMPLTRLCAPLCWQLWGGDWRDHFRVIVSLCAGAPARIAAINAALRTHQPSYLHLYELKSFWYDKVLCDADMDYHSFSKIEGRPPIRRIRAPTLVC